VVLVDKALGRQSEYLAINPKDKVPTLQTGSRIITENPAIQLFLARRHPEAALLPTGEGREIEALELTSWFAAGIHRFVTPLRFPQFTSEKEEAWASIRARATVELERAFEILEERLRGRDWLFDDWSIADAYLLWLWFRATGSGMDGSRFPLLIDHASRCEARPSVSFVLDREEEEFARLRAAGSVPVQTPDYQVGRAPKIIAPR
jgi:glutathione S-transferase